MADELERELLVDLGDVAAAASAPGALPSAARSIPKAEAIKKLWQEMRRDPAVMDEMAETLFQRSMSRIQQRAGTTFGHSPFAHNSLENRLLHKGRHIGLHLLRDASEGLLAATLGQLLPEGNSFGHIVARIGGSAVAGAARQGLQGAIFATIMASLFELRRSITEMQNVIHAFREEISERQSETRTLIRETETSLKDKLDKFAREEKEQIWEEVHDYMNKTGSTERYIHRSLGYN